MFTQRYDSVVVVGFVFLIKIFFINQKKSNHSAAIGFLYFDLLFISY